MRASGIAIVAALALSLCLGYGCKAERAEGRSVLAKVNNAAITEDDRYMLLEGGHGAKITPEDEEQALQDLINRELLYQSGLKLRLDQDPKYRNAIRIMEMRIEEFKRVEMARQVLNTQIWSTVSVTREDVDRFIEQNKGRLRNQFHLAILRFTDEAEAQKMLSRIWSGTAFETIAQEKAGSSLKAKINAKASGSGSDLGYLRFYQIPSEWRDAIERLRNGEVSRVLKGKPSGYVIVKLIEMQTDPKTDFEKMRGAISNRIRDEKLSSSYEAYLKKLRSQARITVYREAGKSAAK